MAVRKTALNTTAIGIGLKLTPYYVDLLDNLINRLTEVSGRFYVKREAIEMLLEASKKLDLYDLINDYTETLKIKKDI